VSRAIVVFLALAAACASGCARVSPWQRETLARPPLQEPPWPVLRRGEQHVFEIREGSQGGYGAAGGGCGCN
jgi:hypothetical protein